MLLNIYLIGVVISLITLMLSVGYNTAKDKDWILDAPQVLLISGLWPLAIPFMIGAYLGSKK
jgi:ABC-type transport system involved in multi-copper enzyme maturation permease subunit